MANSAAAAPAFRSEAFSVKNEAMASVIVLHWDFCKKYS